ncbi:MAG: VWA domain-containing protein [Chloroflexi bacterium]|nr:VWA domain-containing protein [Chloroflexota bacterium]
MSIQDSVGVYDQAEFAENPEQRCPIVLILDVSGSMGGQKIQTVNQALVKFGEIIKDDSVTALRADVAIIEFDHEARVVQDFTNGTDFEPPTLSVKGGTNYSKAINLALDISEARKQSYRDGGVAYYRSLAYFLTDGYPEHDNASELAKAAERLKEMEENRNIAFFCFGIGTPDLPADMSELAKLAPREPKELTNMAQLDGSIQWLSRSVAAVSQSQPGEAIRLPEPDYLDF